MGTLLTSPIKRFPGDVELKDPIPYKTILKYEKAAREISKEDVGEQFIPIIVECVEKWQLKNFPTNPTAEDFPGTPRKPVMELLSWLLIEISKQYKGNEDNDPNE